ncbi:hypothetical protein PC116_g14836 [Phytophthora cactorum]|uniref:Uncharacterized protein n=1 Tax=Phytophthora cactorum TaxID=29920 RepID=A0A8T1D985_9STRA|nr:hypothetical protein PC117_g11681 [Phytophthora cactorum]KAG3039924.1 hypothetical protein PC119_g1783 [Phytophthora cactorum]KAG3165623.1 hypothetical protein C6341_g12316 [Phytophthora cactorum]KAG3183546.1 hypothetical protein PC128_g14113 [Phytophthora cactorum]KAG4237090.1 hypothetical protein PC116_g14836 [Phytophthora cactorum]
MEENIVCTTCPDVENNAEKQDQASQKPQATQSVTKALDRRSRVGSEPRTMSPGWYILDVNIKYTKSQIKPTDQADRLKICEDSNKG